MQHNLNDLRRLLASVTADLGAVMAQRLLEFSGGVTIVEDVKPRLYDKTFEKIAGAFETIATMTNPLIRQ